MKKLRIKRFFLIFSLLGALLVALYVMFPLVTGWHEQKVYHQITRQMSVLIANSLREDMFSKDQGRIEDKFNALFISPVIARISVYDAFGRRITQSAAPVEGLNSQAVLPDSVPDLRHKPAYQSFLAHPILTVRQFVAGSEILVPVKVLDVISGPEPEGNLIGYVSIMFWPMSELGFYTWLFLALGLIVILGLSIWLARVADMPVKAEASDTENPYIKLMMLYKMVQDNDAKLSDPLDWLKIKAELDVFQQQFESILSLFCDLGDQYEQLKSTCQFLPFRLDFKKLDNITTGYLDLRKESDDLIAIHHDVRRMMEHANGRCADLTALCQQLKKMSINLALESSRREGIDDLIAYTEDIRQNSEQVGQKCSDLSYELHNILKRVQAWSRKREIPYPDPDQTSHFWINQRKIVEKTQVQYQSMIHSVTSSLDTMARINKQLSVYARTSLNQLKMIGQVMTRMLVKDGVLEAPKLEDPK